MNTPTFGSSGPMIRALKRGETSPRVHQWPVNAIKKKSHSHKDLLHSAERRDSSVTELFLWLRGGVHWPWGHFLWPLLPNWFNFQAIGLLLGCSIDPYPSSLISPSVVSKEKGCQSVVLKRSRPKSHAWWQFSVTTPIGTFFLQTSTFKWHN